jgi:hypothetical protein
MSVAEFFDRLRARLNELFQSEKRSTRLFSRLVAVVCAGLIFATIAPTIADELTGEPAASQSPAPQEVVVESPTASPEPEVSASPSPSVSDSPSPEATVTRPVIPTGSPTPLEESTDSETAEIEIEPAPLEIQPRYNLRMPATVAIDPRAKSYLMPHIVAQPEDSTVPTLACISGSALAFDIMQKQSSQTFLEGPDYITGDRSSFILVAGTAARVINLINSYSGLVAYSDSTGIAGRPITIRLVALNKVALDPTFCSAARSSGTTLLRPLELSQSTVKGGGTLK